MSQNESQPAQSEPTEVVQGQQPEAAEAAPAQTPQQPAEAAKKGSLKQAVAQQVRKYKLKVNGRQREVDEKTLIALAQKSDAADEKFQKSSAKQKEVEKLFSLAKNDPDRFIKEVLGEQAVEFSKKRLVKELEELSLDPKEKELRDYKRKVEAYEAKEKEAEAARQAEADSKAVAHWTQHYDTVLPKAITDAGLPLTQDVIRHATDIMIANLEQGFDLPMEAVMELTRDRYISSVKKFLGSADANKLADLLGEQVAGKLGIKKQAKQPAKPKQAVQTDQQEKAPRSQSQRMAQLDRRLKQWANS